MSSFNQGAVEAFRGTDDMQNDLSQNSHHSHHSSHHNSHHQPFTVSPCASVEYNNDQQRLHHLRQQQMQQIQHQHHHHHMMPMMSPSSSSSTFYSASTSSPQGSSLNLQSTSNTTTTSTTNKNDNGKNKKKPSDKPKRPLSAYNLFFQLERERLLSGDEDEKPPVFTPQDVANMVIAHQNKPKRPHRKTHGKIGFAELARTIAARWKKLDKQGRIVFEERAKLEKARYRVKVADWLERQTTRDNKSKEKLLAMMPAGGPASPSQQQQRAPLPGSMSRKVSMEHTTSTRSPEPPMYPPNNKMESNMNGGAPMGNNSMNSMGTNGSNCSSATHDSSPVAHVVPPYTPPRRVSMIPHPNNSNCATAVPVAAFPGQLEVPNFHASNNNGPNGSALGNDNLRDLVSQGDAYLREDSHMARLQKLHAMQVQMEQELHQMAMEQGYFNNNNNNSSSNNTTPTPSNVQSGGGFFNNGGGCNNNNNGNNGTMLNSTVDLPSTLGVNGVSLPPLPRLSDNNHDGSCVATGNSFLMPKQQHPEDTTAAVDDSGWTTHLDPRAGLASPTLELADHPIVDGEDAADGGSDDDDDDEPVGAVAARDDVVVGGDDDDEDNLHLF